MGGNFHDMLRLGETSYALAAGEVSGQGEAAGLHLAQVARQLRGGLAASHEPGCVLAEINRMLVEDARRGFLVTMFLAVLDTASGDFAWASAGGTPAGVLDGARASIQWLDGGSDTPMGMLANWDYPEGTGRIEPGGALLAHTAGVNEHVSTAGALLGRDEIEACLGGASGGPAGERLADRVFAQLEAQATLQIDGNDFTILAAERME
jgi:serine phosphatase RsbU (regulator of sigma subunit)